MSSRRLKFLGMCKKLLCVIVAFLLFVCLCGCSNKSFEGEVCELRFEEEYTTIILLPTNVYNGKTMQTWLIPYVRTYPDRWYVRVRTFNTEKQNYEYNECYVTHEVYDTLKIGDWFVYNEDYCFDSEPYTQQRK